MLLWCGAAAAGVGLHVYDCLGFYFAMFTDGKFHEYFV